MKTLNKPTLVLNKGFQPINVSNVERALVAVWKEKAMIVDENYSRYTWDEWVEMSFLEWEEIVEASAEEDVKQGSWINAGKYKIKCPEIIAFTDYNRKPKSEVKLTRRNIFIRDRFRCQYTGKRLSLKDATLDHIMPQSRGGATSWENLVICDVKVNARKGSKTPQEAGLTLLSKPKKPAWHPIYSFFTKNCPESWSNFIDTKAWNEETYWDAELKD